MRGIVDEGFREMNHGTQDGGPELQELQRKEGSRVEGRGSGSVYNLADADSSRAPSVFMQQRQSAKDGSSAGLT